MNKLIALFSAGMFVFTLTATNAWAADPVPLPIDRHAVWTKIIEDNTGKAFPSSDNQASKTSGEHQEKQKEMEDKSKKSS